MNMGEMKEREKLHTGDIYLPGDEEIMKEQAGYQDMLCEYNQTKPSESEKRAKMLKKMHLFTPTGAGITVISGIMCMPTTF